jgi:phage replication O-like protein O
MSEDKGIQVEDGEYTRIHNAILEAMAWVRLSGAEFRCLHFLLRKTYGWRKKEDRISLSQWAEATKTKRPHVLKTLNELVEKNIIYRKSDGSQIPVYGFNKYSDTWKNVDVDSERGARFTQKEVLPKQVTVTNIGNTTVTKAGNGTVTNIGTHKRKKESLNKVAATPRKPAADPRSSHPAIVAVRTKIGKYPPKELYDQIISTLGNAPDETRINDCRCEWVGRGYNPNSWKWLTEWYLTGIPSRANGNGNRPGYQTPQEKSLAALKEVMEEEEQRKNGHQ